MSHLPKNIIGVVGGMGPYAGIDLVKKIHAQTVAETDQEHLPVVLASMPSAVPDRSAFLTGRAELNPALPIAEILDQLEGMGATVAGMPCVTAHSLPIWHELQARLAARGSTIQVISIIDASLDHIREIRPAVQAVGAFSTSATFRGRLFPNALHAGGFTVVEQSTEVQDALVNEAIFSKTYGIKAFSDPVTQQARRLLVDALDHMRGKGAEAVILGCTELPLALPESELGGITLIDPTLALAHALVKAVAPGKLRPLASSVEAV